MARPEVAIEKPPGRIAVEHHHGLSARVAGFHDVDAMAVDVEGVAFERDHAREPRGKHRGGEAGCAHGPTPRPCSKRVWPGW